MNSLLHSSLSISLMLSAWAIQAPSRQDWPQFLGSNRDGVTSAPAFVQGWLQADLQERWRVPVGQGYAGLAVAGGRVFSLDARDGQEFIFALDAETGRQLWRVASGPSPSDVYGGLGPRVTPTVQDERVYFVSASGVLTALNALDGAPWWRTPLKSLFRTRFPAEGYASSVLADGSRLYAVVGGETALAAFDKESGQVLWKARQSERASYSSPALWDFEGRPQLLYLSSATLFAFDPLNGNLLWRHPWQTYDGVNVATPIQVGPRRLFISAGYDQGAAVLEVSSSPGGFSVGEVWRNRRMKNHFNNSVYHRGAIYGFDNAIFKCIDALTGEELWKSRGYGKGSLIRADGHLIVLGERGNLALAPAQRQSFAPLREQQALQGRCWTPASLAGDRLYLRNQSQILCLQPSSHQQPRRARGLPLPAPQIALLASWRETFQADLDIQVVSLHTFCGDAVPIESVSGRMTMKRFILLLSMALVAAMVGWAWQRNFDDVQITATHVAGNVHMLQGAGGNIGVTVGSDGILIVDDQFAPLADKIRAALKELNPGALKFVLNTHFHGDHTGGNPVFGPEATIVAHSNVRKRLSTEQTVRGRQTPAMAKEGWPVITFDESVSVHFNGEEIHVIHLPQGHTDGDSVIFFSQSNVVHMGDHYFKDRFPFVDLGSGGTVEGLEKNIARVISRAPADVRIIPGHGTLASLDDLKRYHQMLVETIGLVGEKKAAGKDLETAKSEGLPSQWDDWGSGFINTQAWIETIYRSLD